MKFEKSCGAIVFRKFHGNAEVLIVRHIGSGNWSFPKGHMEENETEEETAIREVKEETSLDIVLDPTYRGTVSYFSKTDTHKIVVYFLARAKQAVAVPQPDEISELRWVGIHRVSAILTYENDKNIIRETKSMILQNLR